MKTSASERRRSGLRRLAPAFLAVLCLLWWHDSVADSHGIVAIVNEENPVAQLTLPQLQRIMRLDRKRWDDGTPIDLILPTMGSPAMKVVIEKVFEMGSASELAQFYMSAIYEQKITASPPTSSADDALASVAQSPGAIALVPRESATTAQGVKILIVDGL